MATGDPPASGMNPGAHRRPRRSWTLEDYVQGLERGDRVALGRAITLVESTQTQDRALANELLQWALPRSGHSFRIGITGVPGVGKSTFIERFGLLQIERGHRVAVLAVDPTSRISHGSILGDKTRMEQLSVHPAAFVRPTPAGEALGGVANTSRETIRLCEAAGFDIILVETVGVGQSETAVYDMVDAFLLLLLPGGGDELQGIKRGIVEMADLVAINKADGELAAAAARTRREYARALHLFPQKASGWSAEVYTCSAQTGQGVEKIVDVLTNFRTQLLNNGYFEDNRRKQNHRWLHDLLRTELLRRFYRHPGVRARLPQLERAVVTDEAVAQAAAEELLSLFSRLDNKEV